MKLASFDIFDTTLIRKCGKPGNIFYLLAHRLYPNDTAKREAFLVWRRKAENEARKKHPGKDVTIDDIYSSNELKGFDEYDKKELIEAEKSVEAGQLTANPAIRDIINGKREQGYTICFISDMYLPSTILKEVLAREGCIKEDEHVYVSCEWNARKSNGKLYKKLKKELRPTEWEHYGDHPASDVRMARRNGIKAIKVETPFNSAESSAMQPSSEQMHYESSILAGYSRAARIKFNNPFASLAADFIAPAYIAYIHWVIKRCKEEGVKRLYFLSRDSYILQRIAEELPHEGIEFKYLFVSRKSLLLPYLHNATAEKFLAVQDKQTITGKNIDSLLASLGTSKDELATAFGIKFQYNRITNRKEENDFLDKIFNKQSTYLPELNRYAAEKQQLLVDYFAQEGVFAEENTAMVDVGWLGTTRLMINSILKEAGYPETLFFYYGVRGDVLGCQYGRYDTFYRPEQLSTEGTTLIENYFSASPYPSTLGYKRVGEHLEPIFPENCAYKESDIIKNNANVAKWMCKEIGELHSHNCSSSKGSCHPVTEGFLKKGTPGSPLAGYFWQWGKNAVEEMLMLRDDIDITPLLQATEFDATDFVRRLTFKELFSIVCLGSRATAFDKGSLRLTCGKRLFPTLHRIAQFTGNIRRRLYLKLRK